MVTKMKPRQDSLYNGRNVAAGEVIEVADSDVASMHTCGWDLASKPPKKLADNKPAKSTKGKS